MNYLEFSNKSLNTQSENSFTKFTSLTINELIELLRGGLSRLKNLTWDELIELLRNGHLFPDNDNEIKIEIIENYFGGLLYNITTNDYIYKDNVLIIGGVDNPSANIQIVENHFGGLLYIIDTDNYRQFEKTLIIGGNQ